MIAWNEGPIEGVVVKNLLKHQDQRGYLCELFRSDEAPSGFNPAMSYLSFTEPGASRGPHEHRKQTDYFAVPGPGNFMVKMWDSREDSSTRGNCMTVYAGQDKPVVIIIPPGVVHGYTNISRTERGMVINYPDRLYRGTGRNEPVDEVRYEDEPDSPYRLDSDAYKKRG